MSTKIYDGMIVRNKNISELYNVILNKNKDLKRKQKEIFLNEYLYMMIKFKYHLKDIKTINDIKKFLFLENFIDFDFLKEKRKNNIDTYKSKNIYYILNAITEQYLIKNKENNCFHFNYLNFTLFIYPISKRKTLLYPIGNMKYLDIIKDGFPYIEEYGYWNNSDEPEEVTIRQWKQRKKDWDKVLPGLGFLGELGLKYTLFEKFILEDNVRFLKKEEILEINKIIKIQIEVFKNHLLSVELEETKKEIEKKILKENQGLKNSLWSEIRDLVLKDKRYIEIKEEKLLKIENKFKVINFDFEVMNQEIVNLED